MAEEKSVQAEKKAEPKMVPESKLKSAEDAAAKLSAELRELKKQNADVQSELKILREEMDEEGISKVKQYHINREKDLNDLQAKLDEREASVKKREAEAQVQALASKYGIDIESIGGESDPEKKALELYAERLTKEKRELEEKQPAPESIYETATPGSVKKMPKDMTDEEFEQYEKEKKAEALARK